MNIEDHITFREDFKLWWPNYDHSPVVCHSRVTRTSKDIAHAIKLLPASRRKLCIQAGGHAGVWPLALAKHFEKVHTFEPDPFLFECLVRNVERAGVGNVEVWHNALGHEDAPVMLRRHVSAGGWRVDPQGTVPVYQTTLDSLREIERCDALFLDIEGYEACALQGAFHLIQAWRPVIHVEMLPRAREQIHAGLIKIGYVCHFTVHADSIYLPKEGIRK